jgi:pyruvate/2-oxoglutarate dehydrogenase complex dihydrolipoamide dehydrogenase (E3) component
MTEKFDLIVIGGGTAGLVASGFAAQLGIKTALIERDVIGGDCTWTGCMPSKALLKAAKMAHSVRAGDKFGILAQPPQVDMGRVRAYVRSVVEHIYAEETPEKITAKGIQVVIGEARFADPHTIRVGDRTLSARRFIITTGARPRVPNLPGLDRVAFHTSRTIFDNDRLPRHLIVMGAGPVGMELAQAYARFGAQVTLIDTAMLPRDEPEVAQVMAKIYQREGVRFVPSRVASVDQRGEQINAVLENGETIHGDMLLVAVGRQPNVESLDLAKAGVDYSADGITVDPYLRTSARHIFAAGDCTGGPHFTHYAGFQGAQAVRNALLPGQSRQIVGDLLPWVTFTEPEIAHVGLSEAQAREQHGDGVMVHHDELDTADRAVCEDDIEGFIKIVYKGHGDLLGVTIVAGRAGEMITEFVLAMKHGLNLRALVATMHPYPTYSDIVHRTLNNLSQKELLNTFSGKALKMAAAIFN